MSDRKTRIVIVDDHPLVRRGLADVLQREADMAVCGEAESLDDALRVIRETVPDLAIIDLTLRESSGLELIKEVRATWPSMRMLVSSMQDETLYAERCLRAGATGYINKDEPPSALIDAIRNVMAGETSVSPDVQQLMRDRRTAGVDTTRPAVESLTDRELEVFGLLGRGLTTREIAERLTLSPKTIEAHRENIKSRLGLKNAAQLTQHAVRWVMEQP